MRDLEKSSINKFDFIPKIYTRYFDDIFCIIPGDKADHMTVTFEK